MSQFYSDPSRENDAYALPDCEVFKVTAAQITLGDWAHFELEETGWYYWYCLPGCLPDSDPIGPFASEQEAIADARENSDYSEEG